jgi:Enoyl-(Acyl carrier protein) reductase
MTKAFSACVDLTLPGSEESVTHIAEHVSKSTNAKCDLRPYACNATVESDVKQTWNKILDDFGKVDVLVTAAGIVDNVEAENYDYPRWRMAFCQRSRPTYARRTDQRIHYLDCIHVSNNLCSAAKAGCVQCFERSGANARKEFGNRMGTAGHSCQLSQSRVHAH